MRTKEASLYTITHQSKQRCVPESVCVEDARRHARAGTAQARAASRAGTMGARGQLRYMYQSSASSWGPEQRDPSSVVSGVRPISFVARSLHVTIIWSCHRNFEWRRVLLIPLTVSRRKLVSKRLRECLTESLRERLPLDRWSQFRTRAV